MKASDVLKNLAKRVDKYAELKGDGFDFIVDEIPLRIIRRTLLGKNINGVPLKALSEKYILARKGFQKGEAWFYARKQLNIKESLKFIKGTLSAKRVVTANKEGNASELKLVKFKAEGTPKLSGDARVAKSNLTLTGDMLSSIIGFRSGNIFTFKFSSPEADEKAMYARKGGRPFFGLSQTDEKGLRVRIASIMRKNLRDIFKS